MLFPSGAGLDLPWPACVKGVKLALPRGEAKNLQPKSGERGAADMQGEPLPTSLGRKVTREPTGGASVQDPLMANGTGWEEGNEGMGPSLGKDLFPSLPPSGTSRAGLVSYLTPHFSRGSPVPTTLVPGVHLLLSPHWADSAAPRAPRLMPLPRGPCTPPHSSQISFPPF